MNLQQQDIYSVFRASSQRYSAKTAVTFKHHNTFSNLTYSELDEKIGQFRAFLKHKGVEAGDKVVLILNNQPEFPISFFALMSIGAVAVPIDIQYSLQQVKGIITHCEAKLVLTTVHHSDYYKDGLNAEICIMDKIDYPDKGLNDIKEDIEEKQLAVIFYTSGTTSDPKGVMLSHKNILANFYAFKRLAFLGSDDVYISILPLHHAYAFNASMLSPLLLGGHVAFVNTLSSAELISCMVHVRATVFIGVPQLYSLLHKSITEQVKKLNIFVQIVSGMSGLFKRKLRNKFGGKLKYLICGGAKMETDIACDFNRWGFHFLEGYGLTETAPVVSFNTPKRNKVGSAGIPLQGVDVQIRLPEKKIQERQIGEVWVRGENVMQGYYKNTEQTRAVLQDGWFFTGDLGYIDEDGFLFLTGRRNEMIVLPSGKNISPVDVEKEYLRSPFLKEMGVLAFNDELVAVISPDEKYFKKEGVSQIRERIKWEVDNISEHLPSYKRLKGFIVTVDDLPRTRLGKLRRFQLKDIYSSHLDEAAQKEKPGSGEEEVVCSEFKQKSLVIIESRLNRKVALSSHLELDLGLDSLNKVEMLLEIQEALQLQLDDEELEKFYSCATIKDLLYHLEESVGSVEHDNSTEINKLQWKHVLDADPSKENKKQIKLHFGVLSTIINFCFASAIKTLALIFFRLEVKGREHLKTDVPFMICANHVSFLDALFIVAALPMRQLMRTYFLGLGMFFEKGLIRPFISLLRLIPIEMSYNLVEALRSCIYVYKNGKNICFFPEGQRSVDGNIKQFKKGVGILITEFGIPVIPVYIEGAFKVWPRTRKWPKPGKVKVSFGALKTYDLGKAESEMDQQYAKVANFVQAEVTALARFS